MEEDDLKEGIRVFLESLEITPAKAKEISQATRLQADSALWLAMRRDRLTSSNCGVVARLLDTTPRSKTVKKIRYPQDLR